jgi:DNA-binding NarL/FixJ family response regulator
MLKILIVEDEPLLAKTLKHLIELNPRFEVIAITDDLQSALEAVEERRPNLALVDLQLARGSTGFSVAVKLNEIGVPSLFTTGKAPAFPMPDLALGCLMKPYTEEDIVRALKAAEDILRGRERLRPSRPENLTIYSEAAAFEPAHAEIDESFLAEPAMAARKSFKSVLSNWWSA